VLFKLPLLIRSVVHVCAARGVRGKNAEIETGIHKALNEGKSVSEREREREIRYEIYEKLYNIFV
jgi:hypothetical protein